jgi:hypothetical protein
VFFALVPLPINFFLNNVLAGITTDAGVSVALTVGQLAVALTLETIAIVLAVRVLRQRKRTGQRASGTAILAIVLAAVISLFMVASTALYYFLLSSGVYL